MESPNNTETDYSYWYDEGEDDQKEENCREDNNLNKYDEDNLQENDDIKVD